MAPSTSYTRLGTARPDSSFTDAGVNRPMTAVRGAGYTSHGKQIFDPLNQASHIQSGQSEPLKEESYAFK